jgi:hypothetical protein
MESAMESKYRRKFQAKQKRMRLIFEAKEQFVLATEGV